MENTVQHDAGDGCKQGTLKLPWSMLKRERDSIHILCVQAGRPALATSYELPQHYGHCQLNLWVARMRPETDIDMWQRLP